MSGWSIGKEIHSLTKDEIGSDRLSYGLPVGNDVKWGSLLEWNENLTEKY